MLEIITMWGGTQVKLDIYTILIQGYLTVVNHINGEVH